MLIDRAFEQGQEWLSRWEATVLSGGDLPSLAAAISALNQKERLRGAQTVIPLLSRGWTVRQLDDAISRQAEEYAPYMSADRAPRIILEALSLLALLSPAEYEEWLTVADNRLMSLADTGTIETLHAWRVVAPGLLAPLCVRAGMSLDEAATHQAAGTLTESSLRTMIALNPAT
jgi:hypothetical protein